MTPVGHQGGRATAVVSEADGVTTEYPADHVISSMPYSLLAKAMDPPVRPEVQAAADDLYFRDFLSVALVVPADKVPWTDNWIYIHAPEVKTMRVQNLGSWSPYMVRTAAMCSASSTRWSRATSGGPPPTRTSSRRARPSSS